MSKSLVAATSGALAACVSTIAVYPLDVLLVHYQASATKQPGKLLQQQQNQRRTLVQALVDVLQELLHQEDGTSTPYTGQKQQKNKDRVGGFLSRIGRLYSGLGVKLVEQVARNFVYFYFATSIENVHLYKSMRYQALKTRAAKIQGSINTASTLVLAVLAALGTQLLTAPLDVTSTHAQLSRLQLRTIFMRIVRTEGPLGFYRGFGPSLCLCANPAITNATFDSLKVWLQMVNLLRARRFMDPITDEDTPIEQIGQVLPPLSGLQSFLLGAISKAVATVATYPYIRAKVLLQARLLDRAANLQLNSGAYEREQQELALISGGTGASTAAWTSGGVGAAQKAAEVPDRGNFPRAGSMEPQQLRKMQQQQQQDKVPRAISVQSALDRDLHAQLMATVPASIYPDAGGLGICGSSDDGSVQSSESPPIIKSRRQAPLAVEEAEGGMVAVLVSALMQEGFRGLYRGLGLQLLKTILAASIMFLIKEKLQAQTAHAFARVEHVFGKRRKGNNGGAPGVP